MLVAKQCFRKWRIAPMWRKHDKQAQNVTNSSVLSGPRDCHVCEVIVIPEQEGSHVCMGGSKNKCPQTRIGHSDKPDLTSYVAKISPCEAIGNCHSGSCSDSFKEALRPCVLATPALFHRTTCLVKEHVQVQDFICLVDGRDSGTISRKIIKNCGEAVALDETRPSRAPGQLSSARCSWRAVSRLDVKQVRIYTTSGHTVIGGSTLGPSACSKDASAWLSTQCRSGTASWQHDVKGRASSSASVTALCPEA